MPRRSWPAAGRGCCSPLAKAERAPPRRRSPDLARTSSAMTSPCSPAETLAGPATVDLRAEPARRLGGRALGRVGAWVRWRLRRPASRASAPLRGCVLLGWDATERIEPVAPADRLAPLADHAVLPPRRRRCLTSWGADAPFRPAAGPRARRGRGAPPALHHGALATMMVSRCARAAASVSPVSRLPSSGAGLEQQPRRPQRLKERVEVLLGPGAIDRERLGDLGGEVAPGHPA